MQASTLTVLRIVKELQFDGRTDPRRQTVYIDPVPQIAIVAELGNTQPRIDVSRELRLLVADGYIDRVMHRRERVPEYLRSDGKRVHIESELDDENRTMEYSAWIPDEPVRREVLEYGRYVLRVSKTDQTYVMVEHYATTRPGRDLFDKLAGDGKRDGNGAGDAAEWTLAQASVDTGVPSWAWSRAAAKPPDKPGHLPARRVGDNVYVTRENAKAFARDFDARREQRKVGSKSKDGRNIVAALKEIKKTSKRSTERNSK